MKYLVLILSLIFFACDSNIKYEPLAKADTIFTHEIRIDTVYRDRIVYKENKHLIDSLKTELFNSNYKIERVRYYLNITLRNPSQDKFLKGWIRRAIE